jgi:broad specificity phosphatase PhoE
MKNTTTTFYLLRHGLPEGDDCLRGQTDFALTGAGWQQMLSASEQLPKIDNIISSPLIRCADFSKAYAIQHNTPLAFNDDIQEMNFGLWDGEKHEVLWQKYPHALDKFWHAPRSHQPPEGESFTAFEKRVNHCRKRLLSDCADQTLLLITHAGVIRIFLNWVLAIPANNHSMLTAFSLPYASLIKITVYQDEQGKCWPTLHWPASST